MPEIENDGTAAELPALPDDLSTLTDDDLAARHDATVAAFDALYADGTAPDADGLTRAGELVEQIETLRGERATRDAAAAENAERMEELRQRVTGEPDATAEGADGGDAGGENDDADNAGADSGAGDAGTDTAPDDAAALEGEIVPVTAAGQRRGTIPVDRQRLASGQRSLNEHVRRMNRTGGGGNFTPGMGRQITPAQAAQFAPNARVPGPDREDAVLVASGDIPGLAAGTRLEAMRDLAAAMSARARNLSVARSAGGAATRYPVAYLDRRHQFTLDERATPQEWNQVLTAAADPQALVAAGGWCAPPTTSYDFFNIVCEDGMVDVPTVGAPRGAIQWPISPSFGDIMGLDDNPWTWTNTDDIDALGPDGPEKPCQRIPCPELDDAELACDGICLTVGNLVDYAWPELVENHTRLLMAAQAHYVNMRKIQQMVAGSIAVNPAPIGGGAGMIAPLLAALDLQAWDIRELFRMCGGDILETLLPRFVVGMVSADISLRQGLSPDDAFTAATGRLADWLDSRNIRAQMVSDWQIGGPGQLGGATPAVAWPDQIQALIYPPGTWAMGQGLRLNLGVIRDSVLNATNDHTAAWMEECWLMARIGHQSRLVTVDVCPNGATHSGSVLTCPEIES